MPSFQFEGSETILLVEDDESLLRILSLLMRERGYEVLAARDGEEALGLALRHLPEIDLLVSDLVMPKMLGKALADKLHQEKPEVQVLFFSGYLLDDLADPDLSGPGFHFIQKPFSIEDVLKKARQILDNQKT